MSAESRRRAWASVSDALAEYHDDPGRLVEGCEELASKREEEGRGLFAEAEDIRRISQGVGGLAEVRPHGPDRRAGAIEQGERPVGIEAVRRVMREGGVWRPREVLAEMDRRGWGSSAAEDPLRAVEATISRLLRVKQEIERVERGKYRYIGAPGRRGQG